MIDRFRNLKIRTKLLGGHSLAFILAVLLGGAIIYSSVRNTIEKNIESELANSTAAIVNMVRTAAGTSIKNHLKAVADRNLEICRMLHEEHRSGRISGSEARDWARKILFSQTIGKTGYIFCAGTNGIAVEHPNPGVSGKRFMDHEFVRKMIVMKQGYLEYEWKNPEDAVEKPKAMYMSYFEPWDWIIAASSYRDEFAELIRIDDFRESILSLKFGKTGYAYITDSKGNLIVHPFLTGNFFNAVDRDGRYFVREMCAQKTGKAVYTWKNPGETRDRRKLVIYDYIPEYDWIIASASYTDEVLAPLDTIRNTIAGTVGLIIVLMFTTSLIINASILNPIKTLMDRLEKGASGDLSVRMEAAATDEIGLVAGYFNHFMEELEAYHVKLRAKIDQHRQAQEALSISEGKYRTILEQMEEGYFETDPDGVFTFSNLSMSRILGVSDDGLAGKNIAGFMPEGQFGPDRDLFGEVRHSGTQSADLDLVRADRTLCRTETSLSLIRDGEHRPIGVSGVVRDITERKKREKALKLSEEMFSRAFRNSPGGMFIATVRDLHMINVNDRLLGITGYSLYELMGKELMSAGFFASPDRVGRLMDSLRSDGKFGASEIQFIHASGERRTGLLSAEQVDVWGEACILAVLEDVTESRRLEQEILNAGDRERRNLAMELHDDLCPRLIGIEVMMKLLKEKVMPAVPESQTAVDQIRSLILDAIEKTRRLSRGLFPVSLPEHGLRASLESLAAMVSDVYTIPCRLTGDALLWPDMDQATDAERSYGVHIYYMVHEAVHNSVKHSGAGNIDIILTDHPKTVTLQVMDDGIGISHPLSAGGMGLKLIHYRASRIGAGLDIRNRKGGGTIVEIEIEKDPRC